MRSHDESNDHTDYDQQPENVRVLLVSATRDGSTTGGKTTLAICHNASFR
jgi:hypothetical protein